MKKLLFAALWAAVLLTLAACGAEFSESSSAVPESEAVLAVKEDILSGFEDAQMEYHGEISVEGRDCHAYSLSVMTGQDDGETVHYEYRGSLLYAISHDGSHVYTSADGEIWEAHSDSNQAPETKGTSVPWNRRLRQYAEPNRRKTFRFVSAIATDAGLN